MESRKEINGKLVQWILDKVKGEYADDISLVLIYGSYVNGTANSRSDVDCYFIPKTERGYELSMGAVIDGVGYDIFPMSWERVERIAGLGESLLPLVGDAEILYCGKESDRARFQAMRERLQRNLRDDGYVREIAAGRCGEAGRLCALLERAPSISAARKIAGMMLMTLADAVAIYRHEYFHFGLKRQLEDLESRIPGVPRDIVRDYRDVVEAADQAAVTSSAKKMLEDVCGYLGAAVPPQEIPEDAGAPAERVDAGRLAGLYEEISSTFQKIYVCCESGNGVLAFLSAVCLQRELDEAGDAGCPPYELLEGFDCKNLDVLAGTARKIEEELVRLIEENGGHIRRYESFAAFARENAR